MTKERFTLNGENLLSKVKELINEGSRTTITDEGGEELLTFPVTIGLIAAMLAPVLAAVGVLAAFIGDSIITVEREVATA